jgi:hypothetical protein
VAATVQQHGLDGLILATFLSGQKSRQTGGSPDMHAALRFDIHEREAEPVAEFVTAQASTPNRI